LFGESPSITKVIKEYSHTTKELKLLNMQMTKEIMTQFLENEQVGKIFVIRRSITNHFVLNEILNL
jgi:hypothetical protein